VGRPEANDENDVWKGGTGSSCSTGSAHPTAAAFDMGGRPDYVSGVRETSLADGEYLRELGVAPEERVSVCLEPGAD